MPVASRWEIYPKAKMGQAFNIIFLAKWQERPIYGVWRPPVEPEFLDINQTISGDVSGEMSGERTGENLVWIMVKAG
jgi:hypothetical protein